MAGTLVEESAVTRTTTATYVERAVTEIVVTKKGARICRSEQDEKHDGQGR